MEKESRSGQPYHIRPLESLSGSRPENTVTEAREQVATFRREHQQRRDGGGVAPKEQGHQQQIPRLGEHPQGEEQQHQPRHPGQQGGDHHQQEAAQQEGKVADEPGHQRRRTGTTRSECGGPGRRSRCRRCRRRFSAPDCGESPWRICPECSPRAFAVIMFSTAITPPESSR